LDITSEEFEQMSEHHVTKGNSRRGLSDWGESIGDLFNQGVCDVKSKTKWCDASQKYEKIGDGDPHQNFVIIQRAGSQVHCTSESDSIGNEAIL
jgi:hypothetical protein